MKNGFAISPLRLPFYIKHGISKRKHALVGRFLQRGGPGGAGRVAAGDACQVRAHRHAGAGPWLGKRAGPYVKHLEDRLWEMRLIGRDGIARAIYMTASGRRIVVLRTFIKKTEKTPKRELKLARERAKEVV